MTQHGLAVVQTHCTGTNVSVMMLALLSHFLLRTVFRHSREGSWAMGILFVLSTLCGLFYLGIHKLTLAHQMVGMLAGEAGIRAIEWPAFTIRYRTELIMMALFILPNLLVVLDVTFVHIATLAEDRAEVGLFSFHSFDHFARAPFFRKQHAFLHASLIVLICSCSTSYWMRWRHDTRCQLARTFVDSACLVTVAMILLTHSHGDMNHELASHPAIGNMMILVACTQMFTNIAHLSFGTPADISVPYPGIEGGPKALLACRLVNAAAYLLLAHFLYIDSVFEYLGCRETLLKVDPPGVGSRLGLTPDTELSTYIASSVISTAIAIAALILWRRAPDEHGGRQEKAALLPMHSTIEPLVAASDSCSDFKMPHAEAPSPAYDGAPAAH